jgi:HSP20 family molecular chaperone IbpA
MAPTSSSPTLLIERRDDTMQTHTPIRNCESEVVARAGRRLSNPVFPCADLYETEDEFVLEIEVPGHPVSDLHLKGAGRTITIGVEEPTRTEAAALAYHLRERNRSPFHRSFLLPETADTSDLTAWFSNGVLAVHARSFGEPYIAGGPTDRFE